MTLGVALSIIAFLYSGCHRFEEPEIENKGKVIPRPAMENLPRQRQVARRIANRGSLTENSPGGSRSSAEGRSVNLNPPVASAPPMYVFEAVGRIQEAQAWFIEIEDAANNMVASPPYIGRPLTGPLQCGLQEPGLAGSVLQITDQVSVSPDPFSPTYPAILLAAGRQSDVFLRYKTTCGPPPVLPNVLARNYVFSHVVSRIEHETGVRVSPHAVYLSGASSLAPNHLPVRGEPIVCPNGGELRYLAMDGTGPSLAKFVQNVNVPLSLLEVLHLGLKTVRLLDVIHAYGVAHGDVNWHNFVFADNLAPYPSPTSAPLLMMTWDRAGIVGIDLPPVAASGMPDVFMSPTETDQPSMFHDLFRAYELMRALLTGPRYYDQVASTRGRTRIAHKREPFLENTREGRAMPEFRTAAIRLHERVLNVVDGHFEVTARETVGMDTMIQELIDILLAEHS